MEYIDQLNNKIKLSSVPQRIISLVPSQTELLFELGLDEKIVGLTKFCILPQDKVKSKTKIGGTKNLDLEKILSLKPDLIIAGKEENNKEQILELKKHIPVWISDVKNFESALDMIKKVSEITGKEKEGDKIFRDILNEYDKFKAQDHKTYKALYFIWRKPYMVAGGDTFIGDIMGKAGFINEAGNLNRYPEINKENISEFDPEIILLCSEPYRFGDKHKSEFKEIFPNAKTLLTDGQYFGWYGSRMKYAFGYFSELHKLI